MAVKQRQKLSDKEKDKAWRRANVDYYAEACVKSETYIDRLYKVATGDLDESEYNYLTNPYNSKDKRLSKFPAKLKNYPIVPYILNLLLGEKRKRPILKNVIVANPDSLTRKQNAELAEARSYLQQAYINAANEAGIQTGQESKEQEPMEEHMAKFASNWKDERAIQGQEALDAIFYECKVEKTFLKGFKDWLITSTVFTYKDVINEDIIYEQISPKELGYLADEQTECVEDGEAAARVMNMSVSAFIDRFYDLLVEEKADNGEQSLLDYVDNTYRNRTISEKHFQYDDGMDASYTRNTVTPKLNNTIEVIHVNWKSWVQIAEVTYVDVLGELQREEVSLDYKAQEGEIVTKYWVNQVWEGYRIDDKYYLGIQPIPHQRGTINNPSKCKLLFNGRIRKLGDKRCLSVTELIYPFQHLYNFVHYRMNLIIGKSKDKILIMPIGLMPKREGWSMDKTMYYVDANGILWVDEQNDKTAQALNAIKVLDGGLQNYIQYMYQFLQNIKSEAEELVGIVRQRKGQTTSSEGLGTSERAVFQSNLMTEDIFSEYDEFQETEMNGLLDISKFAWINGKRSNYMNSENRLTMLKLNVNDHIESQYGVFVTSAAKEQEKFDNLKQLTQPLVQNKAKVGVIAEILDAGGTNFSKLKEKLKEIDAREEALLQQQQEAEQQAQIAISENTLAAAKEAKEAAKYDTDTKSATAIEVAKINAASRMQPEQETEEGVDIVGLGKNDIDRQKLGLEAQKVAIEAQKAADAKTIEMTKLAHESVENEKDRQNNIDVVKSRPKPTSSKK